MTGPRRDSRAKRRRRSNATAGKAFTSGESLCEIADLSHVWLRAYIFEFEMPLIAVGQQARINFPYLDNESFGGKVTFIYPHIEPQTRRGEIRLELGNPQHRIRPDMWANVELELDAGEKLTVPASSVIDTGQRYSMSRSWKGRTSISNRAK